MSQRTAPEAPPLPPVHIVHLNKLTTGQQSVAHSMHAPEQGEHADTTMLSVVPGNFPITPDPPRTEAPVLQEQTQKSRISPVQDFISNLPGYQGLSTGRWENPPDPSNTWGEQRINPTPRPVNPPRFSPTNPFAPRINSQAATIFSDQGPQSVADPSWRTISTRTTTVPDGDQTMRVQPGIQAPPPAPRIHCYARASPDPIIFNLPEAGGVADAARLAHNPSRAEPWAQLETWIHTAMSKLGGYLEVNFHEVFSQMDSIQRDIDQLQGVVTRISEEQTNFRQVVDTLRENTFALGDRVTTVNVSIDDLGRRTTNVRRSLTAIKGQLTL